MRIKIQQVGIYETLVSQLDRIFRHNRQGSFHTKRRYYEAMKRFCAYLADVYHLQKLSNISGKHLVSYVIYLQDKYAVEGWAFINHLSLLLAYLIYDRLRASDLLSKYSIADFLAHLKYIYKIKIKSSWVLSEISGKTQKLLDALCLPIA